MRKVYNKLVRDNIPEIIEKSGKKANYRVLERDEYRKALKAKLVEEAKELAKASTQDEMVEELGDIFEVIVTLMAEYKLHDVAISCAQHYKTKEKGGFSNRYFLESVEDKQ